MDRKQLVPPLPEKRLQLFTFLCYRQCDIEPFKKLVLDANGILCGVMEIPFLNVWNEEVSKQYMIVYYAFEKISMAICC